MLAALALARPALAAEDEAGQVFPGPFDRIAAQPRRELHRSEPGVSDRRRGRHRHHEHPGRRRAGRIATSTTIRGWGRDAYPIIIAGVAGPVALFGGLHIAGRMTATRKPWARPTPSCRRARWPWGT